jgi:hypothetical protein
MATDGHSSAFKRPAEPAAIVRAITVIMGTVVGLTFVFGFGRVLNLAVRLGVPAWVALLAAPAVDLPIVVYGAAHAGYSPPEKRAVHQGRQRDSSSARWVSSR